MDRTMNEDTTAVSVDLIELAADILAAYVSNNSAPVSELPGLIASSMQRWPGLILAFPLSKHAGFFDLSRGGQEV